MSGLLGSLFGGGGKRRTPEQVVSQLRKDLADLSAATAAGSASSGVRSDAEEKLNLDIHKQVEAVKVVIYGEPVEDASASAVGGKAAPAVDVGAVEALARAMMAEEVMPLAIGVLKGVDFETRKDLVVLFNYLVRNDVAGFASRYLPHHSGLLYQIMDGYSSTEVALNCGAMLRECIKLPHLHQALLYGPDGGLSKPLCDLFEYHVNNPNFEVASDAFETLTAMLMSNKAAVFECLNPNGDSASLARYGELFSMYNRLLQSDNYVLKRQSLKLLSELLLDRDNFAIMMRYIVDRSNLRIIMGLLRHNQPNIQFEAFHVFKVFVANPEKPADIAEILSLNKARLIAFLRNFQNEKDDEQFVEEKAMLIDTLGALPDVDVGAVAGSGGAAHAHATSGGAP